MNFLPKKKGYSGRGGIKYVTTLTHKREGGWANAAIVDKGGRGAGLKIVFVVVHSCIFQIINCP